MPLGSACPSVRASGHVRGTRAPVSSLRAYPAGRTHGQGTAKLHNSLPAGAPLATYRQRHQQPPGTRPLPCPGHGGQWKVLLLTLLGGHRRSKCPHFAAEKEEPQRSSSADHKARRWRGPHLEPKVITRPHRPIALSLLPIGDLASDLLPWWPFHLSGGQRWCLAFGSPCVALAPGRSSGPAWCCLVVDGAAWRKAGKAGDTSVRLGGGDPAAWSQGPGCFSQKLVLKSAVP